MWIHQRVSSRQFGTALVVVALCGLGFVTVQRLAAAWPGIGIVYAVAVPVVAIAVLVGRQVQRRSHAAHGDRADVACPTCLRELNRLRAREYAEAAESAKLQKKIQERSAYKARSSADTADLERLRGKYPSNP